jgi:endonuclease I
LPFGVITGNVVFNYLEGSVGEISDGSYVYEPRADQKGNLARSIFYIATVLRNLGSDNGGIRVHAGNLAEADRNHLELTTSVINDVIRNQESIAALHELMTQNEGNREEEEDNQLSPTDYQLDLNNNETHEEQTERIMRAYMTVANNFRNGDFAAEREEAIDNIEANHTIISFSAHRLTQAITRLFSGINR